MPLSENDIPWALTNDVTKTILNIAIHYAENILERSIFQRFKLIKTTRKTDEVQEISEHLIIIRYKQ